ncbi:MAG: DNA-directed RNA polymerase subunit H [Candidatus Methanoperedens sp.]
MKAKEKEKEHTGREFKPLKHKMVPHHEILNEDDIKKIVSEYNIEKEQLPKIRISDPVAVEVKASVGDVVRVNRDSPIAGKSFFYRLVIA